MHFKTLLRIITIMSMGKTFLPQTNFNFFPKNRRWRFIEDIHLGRFWKKHFSQPEISTPFYALLKSQKGLNFSCKISSQRLFLVQSKKCFFFNFIKIIKNVARPYPELRLRLRFIFKPQLYFSILGNMGFFEIQLLCLLNTKIPSLFFLIANLNLIIKIQEIWCDLTLVKRYCCDNRSNTFKEKRAMAH